MKQIISASRRCDIPAFQGDWFLERVQAGFVGVRNPFSHKIQPVSLRPAEVSAIVFWSKNYQPFLPVLEKITSLYQGRFLFHFTVNGFSGLAKTLLEPNTPQADPALATVQALSREYGAEKILWRFDPIIFSDLTPPEERLTVFRDLAEQLAGMTCRCHVSFVDLYGKVRRRFAEMEAAGKIRFVKPALSAQVAFLKELKPIAAGVGIQLFTCCEDEVGAAAGVPKGHCIDAELLRRLYPTQEFPEKIRPSRKQCGCYLSRDIGSYRTCNHECVYCYAR
jgi:hypothetical protein